VRSGRDASLALLRHYLERHQGKAWHASLLVRPTAAGAGDLYRCFSDGSRLTGSVIAATGREKSVTWEEEDGAVLELKGYGLSERRMVGVRLTTWGPDGARLARLERLLTPAVERLAAKEQLSSRA
jgi:hypothetical protein